MCFFRRKSKRKAAAAAAAAQAAQTAVPDSSASGPPAVVGEAATVSGGGSLAVVPERTDAAGAPAVQDAAVLIAEAPGGPPGGAPREVPSSGTSSEAGLSELAGEDRASERSIGPSSSEGSGSVPEVSDSVPSSVDMAPPQPAVVPGVPRDEVWGQDGADERSAAVLSQLIESVTMPTSGDVGSADEQDTPTSRSVDEEPGSEGLARSLDGTALAEEAGGAIGSGQERTEGTAGGEDGEGAADNDAAADDDGGDAAPADRHAVDGDAVHRDGIDGDSIDGDGNDREAADGNADDSAGIGPAPDSTADEGASDPATPAGSSPRSEQMSATSADDSAQAGPEDPDLMELPSDRPVPADAIKRASEALDAAVNAAPAVIGHPVEIEDDEAVAYVDAEFTHSDDETGLEAEPDEVASDYSVRVTDPIPVQSLSAPGVSRETSESAQTAHGTQQPTGGPHGGDDERRSALIATVPAVDDTTPVAAELALDARRRIELQGRRFPRPPKTRIITVANQKGGVGKTTTTVNIAAGLAQSGLNVLVIDNDPQGNASTALGIEHRAGTPSVYEILVEGESLASTVQACPDIPNLWGVPATIDLSGSEIELVSLVSRETRLRKAIDKYLADRLAAGEERIDYILIDCPPSLGLLTVNAFVAGREVFIPIQCEYYALEGLSQLLKTIDLIRQHLNPELRVSSILLTMYDGRTNLAQQVAGEVRSHFPAETFKTTIPRSVRISEAPSYGQTVMTYDATSSGALAYLQASRELAERGQGGSSPRRAMKAEPVGAQD